MPRKPRQKDYIETSAAWCGLVCDRCDQNIICCDVCDSEFDKDGDVIFCRKIYRKQAPLHVCSGCIRRMEEK